MSAGQSHSLLLADGDCIQPVLLYCGQQKQPMTDQRQNSYQRSPSRAERYTVRATLLPVCLEVCMSPTNSKRRLFTVTPGVNFPMFVWRRATSAACAAMGKAVLSWQIRTSWVLFQPSTSWPPEKGSSTAGCVASGNSSSHQYVTRVTENKTWMYQTTNA